MTVTAALPDDPDYYESSSPTYNTTLRCGSCGAVRPYTVAQFRSIKTLPCSKCGQKTLITEVRHDKAS